jgi:Flp pilus assembly protein TadB
MSVLLQVCTVALLFVLAFLAIRHALSAVVRVGVLRRRLMSDKPQSAGERLDAVGTGVSRVEAHLNLLLEAVRWKLPARKFLAVSALLALAGSWIGLAFFSSVKGWLTVGGLAGLSPYVWMRFRLLNQQMKTRIEFLPAVEVFYQYYTLAEGKNLLNTLKTVLQENRIRYPIRAVFEQLYRNLSANRDLQESLNVFRTSLGNTWADYFANMLAVAFSEGVNIAENLAGLIADMRTARRSARQERNRLLEIRIANFSPLLFLAVFLFVNFRLDFTMAYRHYIVDPAGRNLLLDALLLTAASFVMGFWLSVKRM